MILSEGCEILIKNKNVHVMILLLNILFGELQSQNKSTWK